MRPSSKRHVLAVLRGVLEMNQTDFSEVADCSASTIQAIELGRLKLSDSLATKISIATNIAREWLLSNDLKKPPINRSGHAFQKQDYAKAQASNSNMVWSATAEIHFALTYSARMRAMSASAWKKGWNTYQLAMYKLNAALEKLEKEFGYAEEIYSVKNHSAKQALESMKNDVRKIEEENAYFAHIAALTPEERIDQLRAMGKPEGNEATEAALKAEMKRARAAWKAKGANCPPRS